ncbi:sensor histidine kinase [Jonesia quinghaiensis]|uniref:sensor histidine kinase n=1 Tax=Jonesia quinghaiensis TaxID=262806 RepID=UPI0003F587CF|nr:HAMP domain-containing sensor histidine kinase [Jonesia quinghaiensis]
MSAPLPPVPPPPNTPPHGDYTPAPADGNQGAPQQVDAAEVGAVRAWFERRSLTSRLTGLVMLILAAGLFSATFLTTTIVRSYLIREIDDDLKTTYSNIASQIISDQSGTSILPSDYYLAVGTDTGLFKEWIQPETAAALGYPDLSQQLSLDSTESQLPYDDAFTTDAVMNTTNWRVLIQRFNSNVGPIDIYVALPLTETEEMVGQIQRILMLTGFSIIAIGGAIGSLAVRRSLRPLAGIERTAAAIAEGDLSRRIRQGPTTTEVGSLAKSLNTMLATIERAFAVQEASEAKMRRFVSDASHELRTPLATIRGYGELYRMGALTCPDALDDTMRRIEDSATRMGSLVEDLLHLARLDEGRQLRKEPVDMAVLAMDAISDLHALDPQRPVRLVALDTAKNTGVPHNAFVIGDDDRLRQVLANLMGNAVRYTPEGSAVEIALGRTPGPDNDTVTVEFRDHGPGIGEEHKERIFERFYRVDTSRTRDLGGSGLGLAIVSAIVAAHGGTTQVSDTEGGGLTVRIELPAAPDTSSPGDETATEL